MRGFADFEQYDGLGLADLVQRGKVTPAELLDAAIERVEALNPTVNAVVMKLYDYGRTASPSPSYCSKSANPFIAPPPDTRAPWRRLCHRRRPARRIEF